MQCCQLSYTGLNRLDYNRSKFTFSDCGIRIAIGRIPMIGNATDNPVAFCLCRYQVSVFPNNFGRSGHPTPAGRHEAGVRLW